jgi:hypothetical protein
VGAQTARQVSAPTWVAVQWRHRQDAIGSEGAKILTQFAPGGEHPGAIHEGELHRPDDTLGAPTLFIVISDVEPRLAADCGAQLSERSAIVWKGRCRSRGAQRVHDLRLGLGRQHCGNLRQRDGRCRLQDVVAALIDVAQAKQYCLDLVFRQHQRRQEEACPQDGSDPGFPFDGRALRHEIGDVAIDRSLRNLQLYGQLGCGDGVVTATHGLEQTEEAGGTGHASARVDELRAYSRDRGDLSSRGCASQGIL